MADDDFGDYWGNSDQRSRQQSADADQRHREQQARWAREASQHLRDPEPEERAHHPDPTPAVPFDWVTFLKWPDATGRRPPGDGVWHIHPVACAVLCGRKANGAWGDAAPRSPNPRGPRCEDCVAVVESNHGLVVRWSSPARIAPHAPDAPRWSHVLAEAPSVLNQHRYLCGLSLDWARRPAVRWAGDIELWAGVRTTRCRDCDRMIATYAAQLAARKAGEGRG